jgi:hypothetical protein
LYMAYGLVQSLRTEVIDKPWLLISAVIIFIISGGVILFFGIKGMIAQNKMSDEAIVDEALNEELEAEEEVYGMDVDKVLNNGKMASINKELERLKQADEEVLTKDMKADVSEGKASTKM